MRRMAHMDIGRNRHDNRRGHLRRRHGVGEMDMKRTDVKIGDTFRCDGKRWKVTDIGTRTVIAIPIKEGWMEGPPYAQAEIVFNEDDLTVCEVLWP
jgi:hypothetical protein